MSGQPKPISGDKSRKLRIRIRQILLLLIIIISVIFAVYYFKGQKFSPFDPGSNSTPVAGDDRSLSVIEPFQRFYTDPIKGELIAEIRARRAEIFRDGKNILTDIEDTRFVDKKGRNFTLKARHGYLGEDKQEFVVENDVELSMELQDEQEPFRLFTEKIIYSRAKNLANTDQPVKITGKDLVVTGKSFTADLDRGFLYIEDETRTVVSPADKNSMGDPIVITAGELQFNYHRNMVFYIDEPRIQNGRNTIDGQEMTFELNPENRRLVAERDVVTRIFSSKTWNPFQKASDKPGKATPDSSSEMEQDQVETTIKSYRLQVSELTPASREAFFSGDVIVERDQDILKCDMLTVFLSDSESSISGIIAERNVRFRFDTYAGWSGKAIYYPAEEKMVLTDQASIAWDKNKAEAEEILFPPGQKSIFLKQNVRIEYHLATKSHSPRKGKLRKDQTFSSGSGPVVVLADQAQYFENKNKIIFDGNVEASRSNWNIECSHMELYLTGSDKELDRINAEGNVKIVHDNIIATSDKANYYGKKEILELIGNSNIQQDHDSIRAKTIKMDQLNNIMTAEEDVTIVRFKKSDKTPSESDRGKNKGLFAFSDSEGPLTVFCQSATHNSDTRRTHYIGKVIVVQDNLDLKSDILETILDQEGNEVQNLTASGNVEIKQDKNIASGNELLYNKISSKIILTGEPAVISQADRIDKGSRIVIYTDQRRVFIDNRGESIFFPDGRNPGPQTNKTDREKTPSNVKGLKK